MNRTLLTNLFLTTLTLISLPALAQDGSQTTEQTQTTTTTVYRISSADLNRAKNYARQAAEERNGGIQRYRAEDAMHGPVSQTRYVENGNGTVTFTFYGGTPNARPTIESVVTVAINGWKTHIDYNGPIRDR
jgi:hypothetical protein